MQFLLFPQCFLLNQIIVSPFVHIFDMISLFAAELGEPKIGILGKVLYECDLKRRGKKNLINTVYRISNFEHLGLCRPLHQTIVTQLNSLNSERSSGSVSISSSSKSVCCLAKLMNTWKTVTSRPLDNQPFLPLSHCLHNPSFSCVCSTSLLKTLWEKEK